MLVFNDVGPLSYISRVISNISFVSFATCCSNSFTRKTKFSFEILEEDKKNQPPQPGNQNKKSQLKSGIKLVIESDKKYELQFLEIETATEFPSIQVFTSPFENVISIS